MLKIIVALALLTAPAVTGAHANTCPDLPLVPRAPASSSAYAASPNMSLAEDGSLLFDYGAAYDNLGKWSDPYFSANYTMALFNDWMKSGCSNDDLKSKFLDQAEKLKSRAEMRGDMAVWPYPFENNYYHLPKGWISGIGQSRIASVLYRAGKIGDDKSLIDLSKAAMIPYFRPLEQGGVVSMDGDVTWIEEAPSPSGTSYAVLNGHITGMVGLQDMAAITGDAEYRKLFDRTLAAVRRDISKFDGGYSSLYSLRAPYSKRPISPRHDYNALHVAQLSWLFEISKDPLFLQWASRFQAYEIQSDTLTSPTSINPYTHGPDKANALYIDNYWSTDSLPTWFRIDFKKSTAIKSVAIDSNTLASAPAGAEVRAIARDENGIDRIVSTVRADNNSLNFDISLNEDRPLDAVAIRFDRAISDEILAVTSIAAIRKEPQFAPITNDCNYKPDTSKYPMQWNVNFAFDGSPKTAMTIHCPGFIAFPVPNDVGAVQIISSHSQGAKISIKTSPDMMEWSTLTDERNVGDGFSVPTGAKFIMITFGTDIRSITEFAFRKSL